MTGFEPQISGVGSDRSTNCITTTAQQIQKYFKILNLKAIFYEAKP